jgi:hypothetical protein
MLRLLVLMLPVLKRLVLRFPVLKLLTPELRIRTVFGFEKDLSERIVFGFERVCPERIVFAVLERNLFVFNRFTFDGEILERLVVKLLGVPALLNEEMLAIRDNAASGSSPCEVLNAAAFQALCHDDHPATTKRDDHDATTTGEFNHTPIL